MISDLHDTNLLFYQFEYGISWERPNLLPIWEAQVRAVDTHFDSY